MSNGSAGSPVVASQRVKWVVVVVVVAREKKTADQVLAAICICVERGCAKTLPST